MDKAVIAWDGEGVTEQDGEHRYVMLTNSVPGEGIYKIDGTITLDDAIPLFMSHTDDLNIIYGGSYDVNMLLKGCSRDWVETLYSTGVNYWSGRYKITYHPRRQFLIMDTKTNQHFCLWDVIGFYQTTFVQAYKEWMGSSELLEVIERMKGERSTFSIDQYELIVQYNKAECVLLVELFYALLHAFKQAEIPISRYDGAGAVASALLRKYNIVQHMGDEPLEVYNAARGAYAGGRIEPIKIGNTMESDYPGVVAEFDINSAYPYALTQLRSYEGATWFYRTNLGRIEDINEVWSDALYLITWICDHDTIIAPFFYRAADGSISYPLCGMGWHWGHEIRAALRTKNTSIYCHRAYYPRYANNDYPFAFIQDLYKIRRSFKEQGNMAHYTLKLGYNSIYGKLAQQLGYDGRKVPRYHQMLWAGQVTAQIRAMMYEKAMQVGQERVIAFATDALFIDVPVDGPRETIDSCFRVSGDLGHWQKDEFAGITMAQSGVYWLLTYDGEVIPKYRGFDKGTLRRADVLDVWASKDRSRRVEAEVTRFVGMGSALQMKEDSWEHWTRWETTPRLFNPWPMGKRKEVPGVEGTDYTRGLVPTAPLAAPPGEGMSMLHRVAWIEDKDNKEDPYIIQSEIDDSYA